MQQNPLEWMPILLPMWLFALYGGDICAAGWVWSGPLAVSFTFAGYSEAALKRVAGFFVQAIASAALLLGALAGIVWRMVHSG